MNKEKLSDIISKGYTYISNSYIFDSRLSDGAKNTYSMLIAGAFGERCEVYYAQSTIAEALHKSIKTIGRHIKALVEFGYISVRRRGSISNVMTIIEKTLRQKAEKVVNTIKDKFKGNKNKSKYEKKETHDFNYTGGGRNYNFSVLEEGLLNGYTIKQVEDLDGSLYSQVAIE